MLKGLQKGWCGDGVSLGLVQASVQYWTNQLTPFFFIGKLKTAVPCQAEVAHFIIFPNIFCSLHSVL